MFLFQAGIFRHGGAAVEGEGATTSNMEVEEGEEGSTIGGGGGERVEEISSEYSGPSKSKSEEDFDGDEHEDDEEEDEGGDGDNKNKKKKRKKYHRHTAEQIRFMEACV